MASFRSALQRANSMLAARVARQLQEQTASDATLVRAIRNTASLGQGRLTLELYESHRASQTGPLRPELAAELIRSLSSRWERPAHVWASWLTRGEERERANLLRLAFRMVGHTRAAEAPEPPRGRRWKCRVPRRTTPPSLLAWCLRGPTLRLCMRSGAPARAACCGRQLRRLPHKQARRPMPP